MVVLGSRLSAQPGRVFGVIHNESVITVFYEVLVYRIMSHISVDIATITTSIQGYGVLSDIG